VVPLSLFSPFRLNHIVENAPFPHTTHVNLKVEDGDLRLFSFVCIRVHPWPKWLRLFTSPEAVKSHQKEYRILIP
jgi:hypothetical protein